jgi:drug/metabolite transporter (DMT)-like permease
MTRLARWITTMLAFLLLPALGVIAGIAAAFGYTYAFVDNDRIGGGDVGAGMSFLAIAVVLGIIGIVAGLLGAQRLRMGFSNTQPASKVIGEVVQ